MKHRPAPRHSALLLALSLSAATAHAGGFRHGADEDTFRDHARVIASYPLYERVRTPRQVCRLVSVPADPRLDDGHADTGAAVIGGIAGGLIGSQFGRGDGRVASAAVGALAGTLIGHNLSGRHRGHAHGHDREVQRCHTIDDWETQLTGYKVTYEYGGRHYTTRLAQDPGTHLNVRVTVQPLPVGPHRP